MIHCSLCMAKSVEAGGKRIRLCKGMLVAINTNKVVVWNKTASHHLWSSTILDCIIEHKGWGAGDGLCGTEAKKHRIGIMHA